MMATCKDCLHDEVCAYVKPDLPLCADFKDRSKYVTRDKGEWGAPFKVDADNIGYKCSECGEFGVPCWHFCPNCGADMRKGENGWHSFIK